MNDYERVARIIDYLGEHFREQPDLDSLAAVAGLSPSHFHRLFHRWAQTTPKRFVQHLTALEATKLLRSGNPVLETALDVGLSGPGRLHDLCVNIEAASPGEIGSGGAGWKITAGFCNTPFGHALLASGPRGLCKLSFLASSDEEEQEWTRMKELWPAAICLRDDQLAKSLVASIFQIPAKQGDRQPLKLLVKGTAFQMKVWRSLIEIPAGETRSYAKLAEAIGSPAASRAVGSAVGSNPLAFIIPCHRVIHSSGAIGNYHWGTTRKKAILAWECSATTSPAAR